jgi:hypothetical protein
VVIASPSDLTDDGPLKPVDVPGELARAKEALADSFQEELYGDPKAPGRVTLESIMSKLRDGYDVLYLVCHSRLNRNDLRLEPQLYLEDEDGRTKGVPGTILVERLSNLQQRQRPLLVVLASCQSAGQGVEASSNDSGALAALGPRLAEAGIPAVVAMQGNVRMDTVAKFMPAFFKELRKEGRIDQAMAAARGKVLDQPDGWVPTLFMRLSSGRIWYKPQFADNEVRWDVLLRRIKEEQRCTPILGHDIAEHLFGSRRDIAHSWAEDHHFPMAPHDCENLPQVAQYLLFDKDWMTLQSELEEHLRGKIKEEHGNTSPDLGDNSPLSELISDVGEKRRKEDGKDKGGDSKDKSDIKPHRILAELPLPIYVTANLSTLLADALVERGKEPQIEYSHSD